MKKIYFISIILLFNLSSCATTHISRHDAYQGVPATKRFSEFDRFFIKPLAIDPTLKTEHNNQRASEIINTNLYRDLIVVFNVLDSYSEYDPTRPEKTLIIEPSIVKMKSIGKGERMLAGAFAGGSAVVLKTTYIDAETNEIIAEPTFYQHANAFISAYYASHDRKMLDRITAIAADYAVNNY